MDVPPMKIVDALQHVRSGLLHHGLKRGRELRRDVARIVRGGQIEPEPLGKALGKLLARVGPGIGQRLKLRSVRRLDGLQRATELRFQCVGGFVGLCVKIRRLADPDDALGAIVLPRDLSARRALEAALAYRSPGQAGKIGGNILKALAFHLAARDRARLRPIR